VVLDTGSSNLAVASQKCATCNVSPLYTGNTTSTSVTIQYGDGSINALVTIPVPVVFGGISGSMEFLAITSQNQFFNCNNSNQGIVGFAYPSVSSGIIT